ncbi:MAG TPA: SCO family protein [Burkholderiaceae bacterium]|nr:SCO family protein [Burkholderiaceae bacterium]
MNSFNSILVRPFVAAFTSLALLAATAWAGAAASPASLPNAASASALPANSIYQLEMPLTDQSGHAFSLADKRGTPMIVSMFYTSCEFACPMLVDAIRATEQRLTESERQHVNILLVSFDPAHDTVQVLQKTAHDRQIDTQRWSLARTDARNVRKFAALLDIQYRALDNGDFNHSTALILVDASGRIVGRTEALPRADPAFVKLVKNTLAPQ